MQEKVSWYECTETVEEVKLANSYKCSSCTVYVVLFSIIFTINAGIGAYFVYFYWHLFTCAQTTIY